MQIFRAHIHFFFVQFKKKFNWDRSIFLKFYTVHNTIVNVLNQELIARFKINFKYKQNSAEEKEEIKKVVRCSVPLCRLKSQTKEKSKQLLLALPFIIKNLKYF